MIAVVEHSGHRCSPGRCGASPHISDHRPHLARITGAIADFVRASRRSPSSPPPRTHRPGAFDADYWAANLRNPVRFRQAVAGRRRRPPHLHRDQPHPLLTKAITDTLGERHHHSLGTLRRDCHDTIEFHTNLHATHTIHPPRTEHPAEPHPPLPCTPWRPTHYWVDTTSRHPATGHRPSMHAGHRGNW